MTEPEPINISATLPPSNASPINSVFDVVYVINLDRSPDRLAAIDAKLRAVGVNYTRIKAVDGKKLTQSEISDNTTPACGMLCTKGAIGCALSHRLAWQTMLNDGYQNALIFEDDAILGSDFNARFSTAWSGVPSDWDIVYVGCTACCGDRKRYSLLDWIQTGISKVSSGFVRNNAGPINEHVSIPDCASGLHAYAVNRRTAEKLVNTFSKIPFYGHIDMLIARMFNGRLNIYTLRDYNLCTQPQFASASTIGSGGGSPYLGNWLLDKVEMNGRGIHGGWLLSETFFRVGPAEFGGWQIVMIAAGLVTGVVLRRLRRRGKPNAKDLSTPVLIFTGVLMGDQLTFGGISKIKTPQFIFNVSMFTVGLIAAMFIGR